MERRTFSLFLRIFTLSSVFFTETLPPPVKKCRKEKGSAHCSQYTRFPESVNARFFQNLDKKFYIFSKSLPFFGVCVSPTCMLQ